MSVAKNKSHRNNSYQDCCSSLRIVSRSFLHRHRIMLTRKIQLIWKQKQTTKENISISQLKGKFISGIEGALASTLNQTTIINDSLYFSFNVFKVYLSNIDSETAEI